MAMTVLPSFQAFLQSTTSPQPMSPLLGNHQRADSPTSYSYGWHHASNSNMQMASSPQYYNNNNNYYSSSPSSSEAEDDDMMATGVRRRSRSEESCTGFKRPLTAVGLGATPLSPNGSNFCPTAGKRVKKKYLKERERCEIVRRVRAGEKQAHLAKEFGVSRAAVCYLLKHQIEIMRRSSQRLKTAADVNTFLCHLICDFQAI
ncbi:hypothetical protein BBO99_00008683 [Phytophthora kernoviae]|uniref:HTH psq-type domain-containing protein n=2 Tax=Phytophthora kernoviae TaxID=325452 RepID=A0A3R7HS27_9STRA|nr:hypothetical protein G195_010123 [Phytophthora kernoviae 00238/432]KAG2512366.1 hypothetical protein JM18_008491 [Phytophthora kernoviae]RLN20961.1 hypothetical protein BBI17_008707 [Phytophthora kernoviae]RLN74897.1 hypothetical protein BBO99_00008683 [Phytophthora kernoviae]